MPLKLPDAPEKGTVGYLKLELRLQTALDEEPPPAAGASARGRGTSVASSQSEQAATAKPRAAAKPTEEEADFEYANRIVSYNVLEFEIKRLQVPQTMPLSRPRSLSRSLSQLSGLAHFKRRPNPKPGACFLRPGGDCGAGGEGGDRASELR